MLVARVAPWGAVVALVAGLIAGCTQSNPEYCLTSAECTDGQVCDTDRNKCVSAGEVPDGRACEMSSECGTLLPICDTASGQCGVCQFGATGDAGCEDRNRDFPICLADGGCAACAVSDDCKGGAPICADNECGMCDFGGTGDADCDERDPTEPKCRDDGKCVTCLTDGDCTVVTAPVCDTDGSCRGCQEHDECGSEVCNRTTGACEDPLDIIYVADNGTDNGGCGTQLLPCRSIDGANGAVPKVTGQRDIILVRPSATAYTGAIDLNNETLSIIGPGATVDPVAADGPGIRIRGPSNVTLEGLRITGANGNSAADGIQCRDTGTIARLLDVTIDTNAADGIDSFECLLDIEHSTISNNQSGGITQSSGSITLTRSTIAGNPGGGITITSSDFTVVNNFIVENGNVINSLVGGVSLSNSGAFAPQVFDFNTVARNQALGGADASGVDCSTGMVMTADDNIVWQGFGGAPGIGGNCNWTYSNIEGSLTTGMGNSNIDPDFVDTGASNYHLKPGSLLRDKGNPNATLDIDLDGELRPDATVRDIGADEVYD